MLSTGLFVVHDTLVGGKDNKSELTGGEDGGDEVLELLEGEIETGRDDTALVQTSVELNDDLSSSSIVDNFDLVDVSVLLHDAEELDEDLGDGAEHNLKDRVKNQHRIGF